MKKPKDLKLKDGSGGVIEIRVLPPDKSFEKPLCTIDTYNTYEFAVESPTKLRTLIKKLTEIVEYMEKV